MFVWYFKGACFPCFMITSQHRYIFRLTCPLDGFHRSPEDSPFKMATEIPAHSQGCGVQNTPSPIHCSDAIMSAMACQTTGASIVYSTICWGIDQSSASLAFVRDTHWWPTEFPPPRVSSAENASIWWRHHAILMKTCLGCYIIFTIAEIHQYGESHW